MKCAAMAERCSCFDHGGTFETSPRDHSGEVSIARPQIKSGVRPWPNGSGTISAINRLPRDKLDQVVGGKPPVRGGPRNFRNRESHALTAAQVGNMIEAERYARQIALPFTRMITIHWQAAGIPLSGIGRATGRFTDLLGKFLARRGHGSAWLWVLESGIGKGGHCHMLAHVPAELIVDLLAHQRRWLRAITGRPYRARVIHSKPIGGRLGLERGNPDLHVANVKAAILYLVKGADAHAAAQFGLERRENGGVIIGKRCSVSQNINRKARREAEFLAKSEDGIEYGTQTPNEGSKGQGQKGERGDQVGT